TRGVVTWGVGTDREGASFMYLAISGRSWTRLPIAVERERPCWVSFCMMDSSKTDGSKARRNSGESTARSLDRFAGAAVGGGVVLGVGCMDEREGAWPPGWSVEPGRAGSDQRRLRPLSRASTAAACSGE